MLALLCMSWTAKAQVTIDFETGDFSQFSFVQGETYPWEITSPGNGSSFCMKSTNEGVSSSTSSISATYTFSSDGYISFDANCMGEGTSTSWDKCIFSIDGTEKFSYGAQVSGWHNYIFNVTAGTHTFVWKYTKDSSVNPTGDAFFVDNIIFGTGAPCTAPINLTATLTPGNGSIATLSWTESGAATSWVLQYSTDATFSTFTSVTANDTFVNLTGLTPETTYYAHVQALCGTGSQSSWSNTRTFVPSDAYSITLNEGTSTNEYVPVYGYYVDNYSKSQFIIPASDLVNIQGGEITALTFYASQSSINWGNATFDVRLKVVNNTEFENTTLEDWDGMESVYSGSLSVNNNTMTINFSTPFTYTEGNLMIGINQTANGAYVSSYWYGVSQETYTALGGYLSNYGGNNIYRYQFLPKVTIDYTPGAPSACPKPTNLIASEVSAHSAVLNWTENGTATAWQICVNEDTNNIIDVTEIPYTLTGLNPETAYLVKVRANCGGEDGMSNWVTVNFTTEIACPAPTGLNPNVFGTIVDLNWNSNGDNDTILYRAAAHSDALFFEDFENGLNNWTIYTEGESPTGTGWYTINPLNGLEFEALSGSYVASAWSWNSYEYDADNWLVSPQLELQGTLKYWVKTNGSYPDHYAVLLSTTGNTISDFTTTLKPMATAPGTWTEVNIDLSAYAGQTGYIAIHHVDYNENYLLIDDFGIYGATIPAGDWMTAVSNTHDITLTGLAPTTTYDVKVKSDCGEDGSSLWSDTYQFTTDVACPTPISLTADTVTGNSIDLSWTGNGESYDLKYRIPSDEGAIFFDNFENGLDNWTIYTEGEAPLTNGWFTMNPTESDINPISGNNVVAALSYYYDDYYDYDYSYNASNWLVTPQLPLQGTLKFWVISAGSSYPEHYSVLLSTTGNAITDFTTTLKEYGTASGEWTQISIDLSTYEGQDGYIAIHHADTDAYFIFIDDFGIYGEATPAGEWMNVSSTTNSATITGLAPLTTYEVQVMSNCGEDGTSDWSSSYNFTTTELLCSAPSNLVISDTTTTGATLTWTETGDATAWQISLNNDEENLINVTENSTYTFSSLTPGTEYSIKVRANCGETESPWSETATFTTKAEITPTEIVISGDTAACPGQYTTLTASTDVEATYAWSNGDNTAATSLTQGTYTVTVTSTTGNQLTKAVTVIEYPTYETHEDITICASELPYDWHGSNVVEPGNYYKSLPTVHGCDSAFYMTLTVNPTYEINDTKTICDNELPYLWNGVTFTEAGTQTVTLTSSLECDSVVTMNLIVNPVVYGVDGWTICASELPYEWNGVTFTEAGTQNATLDAVNGCDSVVTMTLTVNPTFNTPLTAEICQGGSYEFAGNTLTEAGVYTDTLQAENGCDSIITLTLTVNLPTEGTLNASVSVYNLPYILNGQSYDSTGVYTQTLTNAAGCDSTLTLTLTVLNSILTDIDSTICANVLPLVWNNVTFTEAGEQSATFVAANGADSIVTMHLAVNPTFEVTDAKAICESSLPYTWNGFTFTEAGTQSVILQTVNGCDSVVTMTLTVNPVYEVNDAVAICASELPYEWNGIEFSEAGTLPVTLHSVNGCDSVVIMTLTEKQTYNVTENRAICMNELPYEWNGVTFTGAGIEHVTLTAANGCDSAVTMHLTINPIYSTPIIANICEGESYEFFGQQLTESGVYNDTLPTINGCDSIFTLTLNVYPTYNTPITYTMCQGETCVFYGETLSEAGVYTHTLNSSHGCDSVITLTLTVNPTFNTPVAETICEGEYYNFFGQNLNVAGTYTHTLQTVAGCDSVITLTLTVNPTYNTPVTEAICEGESYNFFGQSLTTAGTYTHTLQAVTGCDSVITLTLIVNPIFNTPVTATICQNEIYNFFGQSLTTAGTYTHTLQAVTGCDSVITLTLTVNPTYTTLLSEAICEGESYDFFGQSLTTAGTYNHTLQAVTGCDSVITLTLIVNPTFNTPVTETICQGDSYNFFGQSLTTAGTYTHTLTAVTGCDSVITLTLNVNPSFNTPISATICQGETYNFFDQALTAAGTYSHTLQAVTGCDSVITLTLNVNPSFSTLIDEAICQGETYNFFGQSLTTEGTYNHTLQAVTGCDSVIILNLTINPTFNVTDSKTVCESELPYTWNGVTFTEAGTQNVTLQASSGCDSVVVMTLTVNPTYNVTESQAVCEGELPITWNGVEFTAAGTQNVTLTAANGCDSVVVMTLTVNLNVTSEFTIETPDSCYEWNGQLYCASGDYTQTLTTEAGCDSVVTLHLTTSVGVNSHELETNVYIAPNPAKNVCRILGLSTEPKFVEIYDMRGGLVMRTNDTEFDVRTLSTGLYMVKVYTGERIINLKLVKE